MTKEQEKNSFLIFLGILFVLFVLPNACSLIFHGKWASQDYEARQQREMRTWDAKVKTENEARDRERAREIWNNQR